MKKISVEQNLLKANSYAKKGKIEEAKNYYKIVLDKFPRNKRAQLGLNNLQKSHQNINIINPSENIIKQIINFYNKGQFQLVIEQSEKLLKNIQKLLLFGIYWELLKKAWAMLIKHHQPLREQQN